jgi:tRNA threonylcarbamoyladenosine biosynthesis protein TsaB
MLVLTIRTDNPEAEVGLFNGTTRLAYKKWPAGRQLAATLHQTIEDALQESGKQLADIQGIVCFQGPGSFTGLRIGLTVADTFAYAFAVPIVATMGDDWAETGIARLHAGEDDRIALPHYGAPVHITVQKK